MNALCVTVPSPSGPTRDMLDVTDWRLVYNTNDASSRIKSLQIHATLAGQIDVPVYYTASWGGAVAISLLPASFLRARSR